MSKAEFCIKISSKIEGFFCQRLGACSVSRIAKKPDFLKKTGLISQGWVTKKLILDLALDCSKVMLVACVLFTGIIEASTRIVNSTSNDPNTAGTLPYWLLNAGEGDTIDCSSIAGQSITLTSSLPAIIHDYTIEGAGIIIDGNSSYQAFQVASGSVVIKNVTVQNALSKGGDGGSGYSGGGGGVGGGGALYIHGGTSVTLIASNLLDNTAQGGNGGSASDVANAGGGGGGGFGGGNGGSAVSTVSTGGGGGGHSNGGNGGTASLVNGASGIYFGGGGGGAGINSMVPGGVGGDATPTNTFIGGAQSNGNGGGGAGNSENGVSATGSGSSGIPGNGGSGIGDDLLFGAGGGGGCSSETGFAGGSGVGAGGGGGGANYSGGSGGTLGGGGGGGIGGAGGTGGFGAGGGGAITGGIGGGGFNAGGGHGASDPGAIAAGGGGSGLGGAIFIQGGANLSIIDVTNISGNTAVAGVGGESSNSSSNDYIAPGDGLAMGYDIFMRERASITFDLSHTLTIANPIEGDQTSGPNTSGGLTKLGSGTLKLSGANTYSGATTVDGGTLNLNGSVIGHITVGGSGTLSGNASVAGNLISSGTLSPGNSIGTINTTDLTLTSSSLLEMEIDSGGSCDLIAATGTAEIAGTLKVIPYSGTFHTLQTYTMITATGGSTGTFSRIENSEPSLLKVSYDPGAVVVAALPIRDLGLNPNALAAGSCYLEDGFATGSDIEAVNAALLTLDAGGINDGFNQIQPSIFSGLAWSQIENALLIRSSYSQHLEEMNNQGSHVWTEVIGARQKQKSDGEQLGYSDWTRGATIGLDAVCSNNFRLGVAGSYTYSSLRWNRSLTCANINSYYGGVYSNWSNERGYVTASLLGAYSHYQTKRHLFFSTIDRQAQSSHNGFEGLIGLEAGLNLDSDRFMKPIPFVKMDYVYLSRQGFVESGANSLDLSLDRSQDHVIQSELGIAWAGRYERKNPGAGTFVPRIKLSYINDISLSDRQLKASFVNSDCKFQVQGLSFRRNLGAVSSGLTYLQYNNTIGVTLRYDGQFSRHYCNQAANLSLDINF